MFALFERLVDPFRAHDETMPPATIVGFYLRYCRQIWPLIAALVALGLVISLIEATILSFSGALIDMLRADPAGRGVLAAPLDCSSAWRRWC